MACNELRERELEGWEQTEISLLVTFEKGSWIITFKAIRGSYFKGDIQRICFPGHIEPEILRAALIEIYNEMDKKVQCGTILYTDSLKKIRDLAQKEEIKKDLILAAQLAQGKVICLN